MHVSNAPGIYGESTRRVIKVPSGTRDQVPLPGPGERALVWMDVQGYEGHVLAGARAWLAAGIPFCVELWPYGLQRAAAYPRFKQAFAPYRGFYDLEVPATFRPIEDLDAVYAELGETGGFTDLLLISTHHASLNDKVGLQ